MASSSKPKVNYSAPSGLLKTGKLARFNAEPNSVDELLRMRQKLNEMQVRDFRRKYGDILDLLDIQVQPNGIRVISQYWDNELRCFILPRGHLSLPLEEYAGILGMPIEERSVVYTYPGHLPSQINVAELLCLPQKRVDFIRQGQSETIALDFLTKYMMKLSERGDWTMFTRVLALAVYGVVLFPAVPNYIDMAAISVFMAVEYQNVNPVPAVLADTLLTLSFCQAKRGGRMRCCLQLLTVWLVNHLFGRRWSTGVRRDLIHHPLRDFNMREGLILKDPQGQEGLTSTSYKGWVDFFNKLTEEQIRWKLVWWENANIIYSCGDFHNVPLVSARGGINYNPSMALRQLTYTQEIPSQMSVGPLYFFHDDNKESVALNNRISKAWKKIHFKGKIELGSRNVNTSKRFDKWLQDQIVHKVSPTFAAPNPLQGNDVKEIEQALAHKIHQQKEKLENMQMEEKRQGEALKKGKEEYVQLHKDIRGLKRKSFSLKVSEERKWKEERAKLNEEIQNYKSKESENLKALEAERKRSRMIQQELEDKKMMLRESQEHIQTLEDHIIEINMQWEQDHNMGEVLRKEIDEMVDVHSKEVRELLLSRAEFQKENNVLRDAHHQTTRWVNMAVPTFVDTFLEAENSMTMFYTPPELQKFLILSRSLVEGWNEIRRSI